MSSYFLMNSKTILGVSIATVFALSMMVLPISASDGSFLDIIKAQASGNGKNAHIKTAATIPTDGNSGLFGYGIPAANGVLGITSHGGVLDSDAQSGLSDPIFHSHLVTAATDAGICPGGVKVTSITFGEVGDVSVHNKMIAVKNIDTNAVGALNPSGAFSFTIGFGTDATSVCLTPHP